MRDWNAGLVQDVISGFFILLEDQIRVGDVVEVAGKGGLVEKVILREIRTLCEKLKVRNADLPETLRRIEQ